jgi:hypothetical protein
MRAVHGLRLEQQVVERLLEQRLDLGQGPVVTWVAVVLALMGVSLLCLADAGTGKPASASRIAAYLRKAMNCQPHKSTGLQVLKLTDLFALR